jgi:hypothetical protein
MKKKTGANFRIFEVICGKIQGHFVISTLKTGKKVVSDLMSMLNYTGFVDNASLCTGHLFTPK